MKITSYQLRWATIVLVSFTSCLGNGRFETNCQDKEGNAIECPLPKSKSSDREVSEALESMNKEGIQYCSKGLYDLLVRQVTWNCNSPNVKKLLKCNEMDLHYVNGKGQNVLHHVFSSGHLNTYDEGIIEGLNKTILALITKGASVDQEDINGETPLMLAIRNNYHDSLKFLLEGKHVARASLNKKAERYRQYINQPTPLMYAMYRSSLDIVKMLLKHGADPGIQDTEGRTALVSLILRGIPMKDMGKSLIEAMNAEQLAFSDNEGKNALSYFLAREFQEGDSEVAKSLVARMNHDALFSKNQSQDLAFYNLLDKENHTEQDLVIAQLFIDRMPREVAQECYTYAIRRGKPKKASPKIGKLLSNLLRSTSEVSSHSKERRQSKGMQSSRQRTFKRLRSGSTGSNNSHISRQSKGMQSSRQRTFKRLRSGSTGSNNSHISRQSKGIRRSRKAQNPDRLRSGSTGLNNSKVNRRLGGARKDSVAGISTKQDTRPRKSSQRKGYTLFRANSTRQKPSFRAQIVAALKTKSESSQ